MKLSSLTISRQSSPVWGIELKWLGSATEWLGKPSGNGRDVGANKVAEPNTKYIPTLMALTFPLYRSTNRLKTDPHPYR